MRAYRIDLKKRNFEKNAPHHLRSERGTIAQRQGRIENVNNELKPTNSKTDSSCCFGIVVPAKADGETLLKFLRDHLTQYPSVKAIKKAIDAKKCKINGRVEYFSTHKVKKGDQIEITFLEKTKQEPLEILFEDESLIIYNKPSGRTSESFDEYLVHRLDKETSGAFLLAKTKKMMESLTDLFRKREVEKHYLAIVDGTCKKDKWLVDNFLGVKASYQGGKIYGQVAKEKGKRAITHFEKLKTFKDSSLVLAKPITGRTHQIRVHLKEAGHPVLGDWQYSKQFICLEHPDRVLLHAYKLIFKHPETGQTIAVVAPKPKDFNKFEALAY